MCVKFSPNSTLIASCSNDHSIKLWDIRSSKLLQHYNAHTDKINSIDFHKSGKFLISAGNDNLVKVWDLSEGHQLYTIHSHEANINCMKDYVL